MQPLKHVTGPAKIVALGDATRGTREFFRLKHRMLKFLVSEMGFSIIALEANMAEAYRLNNFVLNDEGDPAKLIKGLLWMLDWQEVLDMTFGFAFKQGSFQADSVDGLREFSVGPAPAGSLDATLAASRIRLFALDLRTICVSRSVTQWLAAEHSTRNITSGLLETWLG